MRDSNFSKISYEFSIPGTRRSTCRQERPGGMGRGERTFVLGCEHFRNPKTVLLGHEPRGSRVSHPILVFRRTTKQQVTTTSNKIISKRTTARTTVRIIEAPTVVAAVDTSTIDSKVTSTAMVSVVIACSSTYVCISQ